MTNPISSDGILAHQRAKPQNSVTSGHDERPTGASRAGASAEDSEVSRGRQALSQERLGDGDPADVNPSDVTQRLASLKQQIRQQPGTAVAAHGHANETLFEAAMTAPA